MSDALLKFDSTDIAFDGRRVVKGASLALKRGEILAVVGESGSGKSTLLKAAMGLLDTQWKVTAGDILFEGDSLLTKSEAAMRRLRGPKLAMIAQDAGASLCPIRTLGDQIIESVESHEKKRRDEIKKEALTLFERFGFKDPENIWKSYPFELSGGMNQRIAIVTAMLLKPAVLLADEPTSALDVTVARQVVREIEMMRDTLGTGIILVTHDIGIAAAVADSVAVLKDGVVVETGAAKSVLTYPQDPYTKLLVSCVPRLRKRNDEVREVAAQ